MQLNETLAVIGRRASTRVYRDEPITDEEKAAVLNAAFRAPTAGNLMLYSIIEIEDPTLKARLAETCDHQPFIAKAPWVLVFVADYQKWVDLYAVSHVERVLDVDPRDVPGHGDLLLACADAIIAAQNAVIAAESLGIGSCYIGDIIENAETHAQLLGLPNHTFPAAMLCFGKPAGERRRVERDTARMVYRDRYNRASAGELVRISGDLARHYAPHGLPEGADNYPQVVYRRKFAAPFTHEMNRSADVWLERWSTPDTPPEA